MLSRFTQFEGRVQEQASATLRDVIQQEEGILVQNTVREVRRLRATVDATLTDSLQRHAAVETQTQLTLHQGEEHFPRDRRHEIQQWEYQMGQSVSADHHAGLRSLTDLRSEDPLVNWIH